MDNYYTIKYKPGNWVEIQDEALGLRSIGLILDVCRDYTNNLYYRIHWHINECTKTQGIQPTSLYPVIPFDKKGVSCPAGEVLYGSTEKS